MLWLLSILLEVQLTLTCSMNCHKIGDSVCVGDSLMFLADNVSAMVEEKFHTAFSVCSFHDEAGIAFNVDMENPQIPSNLPSIGVTFTECEEVDGWYEKSILNRKRWEFSGCQLDFSLIIVHTDGFLRAFLLQSAPRTIKTATDFEVLLKQRYSINQLSLLLDELLMEMEHSRLPIFTETEHHAPAVLDVKEHWPNWAIYVVIICILLTALAFLLGNCITKRTAPLRFKPTSTTTKQQNPRKEDRRMWGAGFSGGLWAAA